MTYDAKKCWYPKFKELQAALKKPEDISEIKARVLYLHSQLHSYDVYNLSEKTYYDEILADVNEANFNICPTVRNMTIAWNLWHITRIEDLTTSCLLCGNKQVFDDYYDILNTSFTDTGNDMSDEEIFKLGDELSLENLLLYRNAVGEQRRKNDYERNKRIY